MRRTHPSSALRALRLAAIAATLACDGDGRPTAPGAARAPSGVRASVGAAAATQGRIFVTYDNGMASDAAFAAAPGTARFFTNLGDWFMDDQRGDFLIYSSFLGASGSMFYGTLANEHDVTHMSELPTTHTFDLTLLADYDAVFLAGTQVDLGVLTAYVNQGGHVYLALGVGSCQFVGYYNPFLRSFGLETPGCAALPVGDIAISSPHEIFAGVAGLSTTRSVPVRMTGTSPHTRVFNYNGDLLASFAIFEPGPLPPPLPRPGGPGKLFALHDRDALSDLGFVNAPDAARLALDAASWFTGGRPGRFLAFAGISDGFAESKLYETMTGAGHRWQISTQLPVDAATLSEFDAVWMGGNFFDQQVLIDYVNQGGNVVFGGGPGGGIGTCAGVSTWNTFLNAFGLSVAANCNGLGGLLTVASPHPALANVTRLWTNSGVYLRMTGASPHATLEGYETNLNALFASVEPTAVAAPLPRPAHAGKIFVANDGSVTSDASFAAAPGTTRFARNVASWFTGGRPGRFLIHSPDVGLNQSSLYATLRAGGHRVQVGTALPFAATTFQEFDAIFVGGGAPDLTALTDYVNQGGNVYIVMGTGTCAAMGYWNGFLGNFGLQVLGACHGLSGVRPVSALAASHPAFAGVPALNASGGNWLRATGTSRFARVFDVDQNLDALFAVHEVAPITLAPRIPGQGKIIVANDDHTLADAGFTRAPDAGTFAAGVASWFTGGNPGTFLAYTAHAGAGESRLYETLWGAGHRFIVGTSLPFTLATLQQFDAVWLGGIAGIDPSVLTQYVQSGGDVYLFGGTGTYGSNLAGERTFWAPFLDAFKLGFAGARTSFDGTYPVASPHPALAGVAGLSAQNEHPVLRLDAADANTQILATANGQGAIAIYQSANTPPVANAGPDQSRPFGRSTFIAWSVVDPDANSLPLTWRIDWGDGSPATTGTTPAAGAQPLPGPMHNYAPGTWTVTLTVTDAQGATGTDQAVITMVPNAVPVAVLANGPFAASEGQTVCFNTTGTTDADGEPLTIWVTTGDGQSVWGANPCYRYPDDGTFGVTLHARDPSGAIGTATSTAVIANVAPTATWSAPSQVGEGTVQVLSLGNGWDAGAADRSTLRYAFDCGTGAGRTAWSTTVTSVTCPAHTDQQAAPILLGGWVMDDEGAVRAYTRSLTVSNAPPVVSLVATAPTTLPAGTPFGVQGSFTDKGLADGPWTYEMIWGTGLPVTTGSVSAQGALPPLAFAYATPGTFQARLLVRDKDGQSVLSTHITVTVTAASP